MRARGNPSGPGAINAPFTEAGYTEATGIMSSRSRRLAQGAGSIYGNLSVHRLVMILMRFADEDLDLLSPSGEHRSLPFWHCERPRPRLRVVLPKAYQNARCRRSKWSSVPFGRALSKERPLPVFNTSRGHQLTQARAVSGGTPSPFATTIKQSTSPVVKASSKEMALSVIDVTEVRLHE